MDVETVRRYRVARTRADLALAPGEVVLGGGTWVFSEQTPSISGIVDLAGLGWPELERISSGLRIGATCRIRTIADIPAATLETAAGRAPWPTDWRAAPLFPAAANALLASFKIWNAATFGGNVCRSFCAGSMIGLAAGLDGTAVVWRPDGGERRIPVADLPTGNGTNVLEHGDVLRAIEFPEWALRARTASRKIALAELGRSGAFLTARVDEDGAFVLGITAATWTPTVFRYPHMPSARRLRADVLDADGYYTDPLGAADWRRGVSAVLAEELREELLSATASGRRG